MSLLKLADSTGNDRSSRHQHPCSGQLRRLNRARGPMSGIHDRRHRPPQPDRPPSACSRHPCAKVRDAANAVFYIIKLAAQKLPQKPRLLRQRCPLAAPSNVSERAVRIRGYRPNGVPDLLRNAPSEQDARADRLRGRSQRLLLEDCAPRQDPTRHDVF